MARKPDFFYKDRKGRTRPGFIKRGGRRIKIGEDLTKSQAQRRIYPQTGSWNTDHDTDELIEAIKKDNISRDLKRKRLQQLYSFTFKGNFPKQYQGNITEARAKLKRAYQEHMKNPPT